MTQLLAFYPVRVALLLVLVAVSLLAIGRVHEVLPRGSRVEGWAVRWAATAQAVVVLLGLVWAVTLAYPWDLPIWRWLTAAVFLAALWSMRHALTDWVGGLVLRGEGTLRAGGRIRFEGTRSRVLRLGLRSAEIEVEDGRLLRLPYGVLARGSVEVEPAKTATRSHTFYVDAPGRADTSGQTYRMITAAVLSPWSSAQLAPTVRLVDQGQDGARFEVTVYPVAPADASKVEEAVRASVDETRAE